MKSQTNKNNYLHLGKNAIVFLGTALLVFNATQPSTFKTENKATLVNATFDIEQGDSFVGAINSTEKRNFAPVEDHGIINPEALIKRTYQKTIEEVIEEDNKITESNSIEQSLFVVTEKAIETIIEENNQIIESQNQIEVRPLYLERTIEDQIAEDNAIIESNTATVEQPLDFETINKKAFTLKQNRLTNL